MQQFFTEKLKRNMETSSPTYVARLPKPVPHNSFPQTCPAHLVPITRLRTTLPPRHLVPTQLSPLTQLVPSLHTQLVPGIPALPRCLFNI